MDEIAQADRRDAQGGGRMTMARSELYQGMLPHPEHLERFEQTFPGASAILFDQMRSQSEHRQALEKVVVERNERRADIGQWLALIVMLVAIVGGVILGIESNATAGASVVLGAFGGGALVYFLGGRSPDQ